MAFSYCSNCRKYLNNTRCPECGSFDLDNDEFITAEPVEVQVSINKKEGNDYHGKKENKQPKKGVRNKSKR